ncbi:5690_t:CDS:2, partial [Acaulospora colombiana]
WTFRDNDLYTEIIPQLAFGTIMLLIGLLGVRSHWRFTGLLNKTRKSTVSKIHIVTKLEYFRPIDNIDNDNTGNESVLVITENELNSKGVSSSATSKTARSNFLEPPSKRWSKYIPVTENSPWSSRNSSRNECQSWYVDVQEDVSRPVNSKQVYESIPMDVFTPPLTPPSPYRPHSTRDIEGSSSPSFHFPSNTLLPNPDFLVLTSTSQSPSPRIRK